MITASFLVKHLRIDWRQGETWFWLDANLANNGAGWQWVAECGADASPYFRIFNPMTQGRKFDPNGNYVRRWCPELARLPHLFIMRHSRLHLKCWLKRASNLERHILTRSSIMTRRARPPSPVTTRFEPPVPETHSDFMIFAQLRASCCHGQAVIRAARSATPKRRGRPRKDSAPPQARCTRANRSKPSAPSERTERQCRPRESRPN
jgi:DNA photolyase-like FAD binding protein